MTLYDYPRVSPGTLLKESEDIRTKLDDAKKKREKKRIPKEECNAIKNLQARNKIMPDEILNSTDFNYQLPEGNSNKSSSLSSFLQTTPTSTNTNVSNTILNSKQNIMSNNANKKDQIQKAIMSINDIYEKYKDNCSEEDLKKFKLALDVLNEFK